MEARRGSREGRCRSEARGGGAAKNAWWVAGRGPRHRHGVGVDDSGPGMLSRGPGWRRHGLLGRRRVAVALAAIAAMTASMLAAAIAAIPVVVAVPAVAAVVGGAGARGALPPLGRTLFPLAQRAVGGC
jgi:hypothetical protein